MLKAQRMTKRIARFWLTAAAAATALSGCATPISTEPQPSTGQPVAAQLRAGGPAPKAWVAPEAKGENLMYVSDNVQGTVSIFSYPGGKLVGTLEIERPAGMCTDKKGDVWITSPATSEAIEYAHGGSTPIASVTQTDEAFYGCSVDLHSGALAVTSQCELVGNSCVANGSVFVFANITKPPLQYSVPNAQIVFFCGYDPRGNLFVDGLDQTTNAFVFGELPEGGSAVQGITLNRHVYYPGGVQWDGKYVAVGDQQAGGEFTSSVHQVAVQGSSGSVVGTTKLAGTVAVVDFWIEGKTIVTPNFDFEGKSDVRLYAYPAGGTPKAILDSGDFTLPFDATVSLAQK